MRISDLNSVVCSSELDQSIGKAVVGPAADTDRGAVARRGVAVDEGEVGNGDALARRRVFIAVRIDFHHRIANRTAGALDRDRKSDISLIADVGVKALRLRPGYDPIFYVS